MNLYNMLIASIFATGSLVVPFHQVQAEVYCEFSWANNPSLNVKGNYEVVTVNRKLTPRGYDRLVESGPYDARVSGNRGDSCFLKHPKLSSINVDLYKSTLATDPSRHIPDCLELNATVSCAPTIEELERNRLTASTPAPPPPPSLRGVTRATPPPADTQGVTPASPPPPELRSVTPASPPPPSTRGATRATPPPANTQGVTPGTPPPPEVHSVTPASPPPPSTGDTPPPEPPSQNIRNVTPATPPPSGQDVTPATPPPTP